MEVNFHVDGSSFHDQHRDVYSAKQRAGPNCACSFRECVGTLCYSLGSSRRDKAQRTRTGTGTDGRKQNNDTVIGEKKIDNNRVIGVKKLGECGYK